MTTMAPRVHVTREETQAKLDLRNAQSARHKGSQIYCTAERVEESAQRFALRPCLYYGDQTYTYAQVNEEANRIAHAAHANGVRRGDVVGLCLENRPGFIFVWLGLAKVGATVAFLNTNVTGKTLAHALAAANTDKVVVGEECLQNFDCAELRGKASYWLWADTERPASEALKSICDFDLSERARECPVSNPPAHWRDGLVAENPAVYIFTSGTTGLPKAAIVSHARWLITADVMQVTMAATPADCFYCFLPLYHGAASLSAVATALAAGASLALRRKFSRREFWNDVRRYQVSICQYVGEICRFLLIEPERADDRAHSLRKMVGAGLSTEVWQKFVQRFGDLDIYEGWGATEANTNTINVDNKLGSCGRVPFWEKTNLRIVRYDVENETYPRDANGFYLPCDTDEVGEAIGMVVDLPDVVAGRFEGYTSAEATDKKILRNVFAPGDAWWASGDLLRCDPEGYCYFIDRIGDTYRWNSENVSTVEVADNLSDFPGMDTLTIYGVQVPGHEGRAGMAAIVMGAGENFDPKAFYALSAERLPRYAAPLFVRVNASADMTTTFKLRKVDLQREGYDAAVIGDPLYVRDDQAKTYVPLTPDAVARALGSGVQPKAAKDETGAVAIQSADRVRAKLEFPFSPPLADGSVVELAPGILWARMPMPMRLDHINVYLLRDVDGWVLVDTGLNSDAVRELWEVIFSRHLDGLPVKMVLCTHFHLDHAGVAHWLTERCNVPLCMSLGEFMMLQFAASPMPDPLPPVQQAFYTRSGMPVHAQEQMLKGLRSHPMLAPPVKAFRRIRDGDQIRIGSRRWRVVVGEGHSPEHACLYSAEDKILISGDQLLPGISSNVSVSCIEPDANPLKLWLASLDRLAALAPDTLVLPSHQQVFRGLHPRVRELHAHHEEQFDMLREMFVGDNTYTAFDAMQKMFPKLRHATDYLLALGEAIAHLSWLCENGELRRELDTDGLYRFHKAT